MRVTTVKPTEWEVYYRMVRQFATGMTDGIYPLLGESYRDKKIAKPTDVRISVDAVVDDLYDRFPDDMKRLAESEQNENTASERSTHGVRSN